MADYIASQYLETYKKDLLKDIQFPEKFRGNLEQLIRLFLPHTSELVESIFIAKSLDLPYSDNKSTWDELYDYFYPKYDWEFTKIERKYKWRNKDLKHSNTLFLELLFCFRVTLPQYIYNKLDLFGIQNTLGNSQVHYYVFLELKEYCQSKNGDKLISHIKNMEIKSEEINHIKFISSVVTKIYLNTYQNINLNLKRHFEDCESLLTVIKAYLHSPSNEIIYDKNIDINTALYVAKLIKNPPDFINITYIKFDEYSDFIYRRFITYKIKYIKYDRNEKYDISEKPGSEIRSNLKHFIQMCMAGSNIQDRELFKYRPRLIGTPIRSKSNRQGQPNDEKPENNPLKNRNSPSNKIIYNTIIFPNPFPSLHTNITDYKETESNSKKDINSSNNAENAVTLKSSTSYKKSYKNELIGSQKHISPRKYITSQSDPGYAPISIIFDFLDFVKNDNKQYFAYAWLCLFSGIHWKRIENLQITDNLQFLDTENILFNEKVNTIHYKVKNGATDFPELSEFPAKTADIMSLELPTVICDIIKSQENNKPFIGSGENIQSKARQYKRQHGGISPTPERLNATFRHLISHFGLSSLEQNTISGYFPFNNRAKSKYVKFNTIDLNVKYRGCLNSFHNHASDLLGFNSNHFSYQFSGKCIKGEIGSLIAQPIAEFRRIIKKFIKKNNQSHSTRLKNIVTRVNELQLKYAYLYLMLQLILGMRPIGDETEITPTDNPNIWLVKQKDSSEYIEQTIIPIPEIIQQQLRSCETSFRSILKFLAERKYEVIIDINTHHPAPFKLDVNKDNKIFNLSPMHGVHFYDYIAFTGLKNLLPGKLYRNNMFRHSLYSHLIDNISDPLLSELFQHHTGDLSIFASHSTADYKTYLELGGILNDLAKNIGFEVL